MMSDRLSKLGAAMAALFALAVSGQAHANYVYNYTATPWSYWAGNGPGASALYYPTVQPLTFAFETVNPVSSIGGFSDVTSQVVAWTYSGHRAETAVNSLTPGIAFGLSVWTNPNGQIYAHSFSISGPLQGALQYPGGTFAAYSGPYDNLLVHPGPGYRPFLGYDIRGNPLYCGPPCSEGGYTYPNYGSPNWAGPQVGTLGIGGSTGGVPEPASWALMIVGFGLAGASLRAGRRWVAEV